MESAMSSVRAPFDDVAGQQARSKERFYRHFQQEATELQDQIVRLENVAATGGERQDAIDHCLAGIMSLSDEVADATDFLPAYDQRTYSQAVKALTEKLQETRSKIKPKSKFQFRTFRNDSAISVKDAAELASKQRLQPPFVKSAFLSSAESSMTTTPAYLMTPPNGQESGDPVNDTSSQPTKDYNAEIANGTGLVRKPSFSQTASVDISNHTERHIMLPASASKATSAGTLTKLENCVVDMTVPTSSGSPFEGLALKNIKYSLILAGRIAGAAHITAVEDSIVVVRSRQVRMHDCKNVDIYLHCASRPIIEGCSNVRFAPIPQQYMISSEEVMNQWDQVDDFMWLKMEPSPNWSVLPESDRLNDEAWRDVLSEPGTSAEEVLKKVGLVKGR